MRNLEGVDLHHSRASIRPRFALGILAALATLTGCGGPSQNGSDAAEGTATAFGIDGGARDGGGMDCASPGTCADPSDAPDSGDTDVSQGCADGEYEIGSPTSTGATQCEPLTTCGPGQYVSQPPAPNRDRECTACAASSYSDTENATECTLFSECGDGTTEQKAGTPTSDRICAGESWVRSGYSTEVTGVRPSGTTHIFVGAFWNDGSGTPGSGSIVKLSASDGRYAWRHDVRSDADDSVEAIDVDDADTVWGVGYTLGSLTAEPNLGIADAFATRLAGDDGTPLWTVQLGTTEGEWATSVAVATDGDGLLAGHTGGALGSNGNAGGVDLFVAKLSAEDGSPLWIRQYGSSADERAAGIAVGADGSAVVAGQTTGDMGGEGNAGGVDAVVVKLAADGGDPLWTRQLGTAAEDYASAVAIDSKGDVVIAGATAGDLDGSNLGEYRDIFVAKLAGDDGRVLWLVQLGSPDDDHGGAIAIDPDDQLAIAGWTAGNLSGKDLAGGQDAFVLELSGVDGSEQWVDILGSSSNERATTVAFAPDGAVLTGGWAAYSLWRNATPRDASTPFGGQGFVGRLYQPVAP
ncbi:MAG: hypothetical protein OEZ06_21670 [Myxococcales bacterium]|nr:hypothetical protein [Myxococcales bacterium]